MGRLRNGVRYAIACSINKAGKDESLHSGRLDYTLRVLDDHVQRVYDC